MPHHFDKLGVSFSFPDNWTVEEQPVDGADSVTVSSPGGAFWWLAVHTARPPVADMVRAVVAGLRDEYAGSDVEADGRWPLDRDPYLLETSVPGIFACGDVRFAPVKRVAAAVGEGSMAIAFVHQYLKEADAMLAR